MYPNITGSTESIYELKKNLIHSLTIHVSLYSLNKTSLICASTFVYTYIYGH